MKVLPFELTRRKQWLCWKYVCVDGGAKPRKLPFYANGQRRRGANGCAQDVAQLVTFEKAMIAAKRMGATGVGFALLRGCGVTALDFDHCIDKGVLNPVVVALVADSYAEISPSGTGVRAFFAGDLGNRKDFSGDFGFEVFSSAGFVTVTGNTLAICEVLGTNKNVAPVSDALLAFCSNRFGKGRMCRGSGVGADSDLDSKPESDSDSALMGLEPVLGLEARQLEAILAALDPAMPYPEWIQVGMALHHESAGEGFDIWNSWSAGAANYPDVSVLRRHWNSFGRHSGRSPVTARSLLKKAREAALVVDAEPVDGVSVGDFEAVNEVEDVGAAADVQRFEVLNAADFVVGASTPWLIKGVLPRAELGVIFGESGSGKSFFASDMAFAIARGLDWRGYRSRRCRVVYIAAEGGGGFRKRLRAYEIHHGISLADVPFGVIHAAPNFLLKADALDVVRAIRSWGGADLVVVDTFAQVTPGGNENAGEHVGRALAHCKGIHTALGAMVLLVHHCGKDASRGARGWSGLRAAADVEIEVVKNASGRAARLTKQKDGDDSGQWGFELMKVHLGMDEDGDVVDSCAVVETELFDDWGSAKGGVRKAGRWACLVSEVLGEFALAQSTGIEVEAVILSCLERLPTPAEGRDTRRQNVRRTLLGLCEGTDALYRLEDDGCLAVLG